MRDIGASIKSILTNMKIEMYASFFTYSFVLGDYSNKFVETPGTTVLSTSNAVYQQIFDTNQCARGHCRSWLSCGRSRRHRSIVRFRWQSRSRGPAMRKGRFDRMSPSPIVPASRQTQTSTVRHSCWWTLDAAAHFFEEVLHFLGWHLIVETIEATYRQYE